MKKELLSTMDMAYHARVRQLLADHHIPYRSKVEDANGNGSGWISRLFGCGRQTARGVLINQETPSKIYYLYVDKDRLDEAIQLMHQASQS